MITRCPHCGSTQVYPNDVGYACLPCGKEIYTRHAIGTSLWRTVRTVADGPAHGSERHSHDGWGSRLQVAAE